MKTASILNDLDYNENGNAPKISLLMISHLGKEIRILFKKGQYMKEHFTPSPVLIEVYEGKVEFGSEQGVQTLERGDMISLKGGVRHDLTAFEDSIVKLSLHKNDSYESIKDFVNH
ncbi:MAG TPA: hypothetical protein VK021_08485 [Flavobacteriaceae bacterium]|nr:hypothetical protein [Flavobacteriaceae bacterium]